MDKSTVVLEAKDLVKSFPQGEGDIEILHAVSLKVHAGEIVAILGPSGAGKSTLLHLLGLMQRPTRGSLTIARRDTGHSTPEQCAQLRNQTIGFLFQFHYLLPELSVLENVVLPGRIQGRKLSELSAQAISLLDTIGLSRQAHQKPSTLSGGEQQRAALARALINGPQLILADEPTGNLDKESGEKVIQLLWSEAKKHQAAVIIVTHQEDIAKRADRWIRLRDGRIESQS